MEMTVEWSGRARPWVGESPAAWAAGLAGRNQLRALLAADISAAMLSDVARAAFAARAEGQAVFTRANLAAEVERQLHGVVFAPGERAKAADRALGLAASMAVKLSPPELAHVPERFRAPDGTSQFAPASSWKLTTAEVLSAEARLLDAGRDTSGPKVAYGAVATACPGPLPGKAYALGADQVFAVGQVATSGPRSGRGRGGGRHGQIGGPRGAPGRLGGRARPGHREGLGPFRLRRRQPGRRARHPHREHRQVALRGGPRSVPRLAQVARLRSLAGKLPADASGPVLERAEALAEDVERWRLHAGDLVLVDEAGLASTLDLDRLATQARRAGAKLLLVGDWAQQGAVGPGGAFYMLAADRGDTGADRGTPVRTRPGSGPPAPGCARALAGRYRRVPCSRAGLSPATGTRCSSPATKAGGRTWERARPRSWSPRQRDGHRAEPPGPGRPGGRRRGGSRRPGARRRLGRRRRRCGHGEEERPQPPRSPGAAGYATATASSWFPRATTARWPCTQLTVEAGLSCPPPTWPTTSSSGTPRLFSPRKAAQLPPPTPWLPPA